MGIEVVENKIIGVVRVTTSTENKRNHVREKNRISFSNGENDDLYTQNIQIADLNCINAAFAVIKWKKLSGFYLDLEHEHFSTYTIDGNFLQSEES
jgi:hypothetical protein